MLNDEERDRILVKMAEVFWRINVEALGNEAEYVKSRMRPVLDAIESLAEVVPT